MNFWTKEDSSLKKQEDNSNFSLKNNKNWNKISNKQSKLRVEMKINKVKKIVQMEILATTQMIAQT